LDAGSINGFSEGDEFAVFETRSDDDHNKPKGHLIIEKISVHTSLLRLRDADSSFELPCNPAPASLTTPAEHHLQLYVVGPENELRTKLISRINRLNLHGTVRITPNLREAHISLSTDKDGTKIRFQVVDIDLVSKNLACSQYNVDTETDDAKLAEIFKDLAHYYWHLKRNSPDSSNLSVDISFYKLKQYETPPNFRPDPESDNLYDKTAQVLDLNVDVQSDDRDYENKFEDDEFDDGSDQYGLKVTNNTQWDLFPTLFYFDNTKFTVGVCRSS
jgi:hypothetical protein